MSAQPSVADAADAPLRVLAVIGSLNQQSVTRVVILNVADQLRRAGAHVDVVDFTREPLALFNPDSAYASTEFTALKSRVEAADVYLLGTPDYHGSMSSVMKNFLDHFWKEFAGKLFASVVASHEKGLTVLDQLRTVARQCYAWSLPYGVSFAEREDVKDGQVASETLKNRLLMLVHDVRVYGTVLAAQRRADLTGTAPGFLARYRAK
jgi:NAD(P)H-dependent FMN reductase